MVFLSKIKFIELAVFMMAAGVVGTGAKRQSSEKKSTPTSCTGEGDDLESCGRYTPDFFKMGTDLAGITWAHAVNNRQLLENALRDKKIMMLEADVIIGKVPSEVPSHGCDNAETTEPEKTFPVMGHPPSTISDLSLETLLLDMIAHNRDGHEGGPKGLKLDFKTIEAFEESLPILNELYPKVEFPLWLNADILPGPGDNNNRIPVDPQRFLNGAANFPASKLSLGWTTRYGKDLDPAYQPTSPPDPPLVYTQQHISDMLSLLATSVRNRNITFPVRAGVAANCSPLMLALVRERASYTLTLWSAERDYVDTEKLTELLKEAGNDRFYLDVPKVVSDKLNLALSSESELQTEEQSYTNEVR